GPPTSRGVRADLWRGELHQSARHHRCAAPRDGSLRRVALEVGALRRQRTVPRNPFVRSAERFWCLKISLGPRAERRTDVSRTRLAHGQKLTEHVFASQPRPTARAFASTTLPGIRG